MQFAGPFIINPSKLCIKQNDIDALRPPANGTISQSQLKVLNSLLLRLQTELIESAHCYKECIQNLTDSDVFKRALQNTIRAQSQIQQIPQRIQSEEVQKPIVQAPRSVAQGPPLIPVNQQDQAWVPHSGKAARSANHKRPRPKMSGVKHDKPKRQNSVKSDKPKDFKKIDLSGDKPIWGYVDQFFGTLPSDEDLERLLSSPKYDVREIPIQEHWSQRLIPIVLAQREVRKNSNISIPPLPPPSNLDVSEFWTDRTPTFQMEDQQMLNTSTIHRLLSAFVTTEPVQKKESPKVLYLKTSPLPPSISFDSYLSHSFDERLKWELESVDLSPHGIQKSMDGNIFAQEIEEYQKSLDEIAPKLENYKKRLFRKINQYRENERKRVDYNRKFTSIVEKYNEGGFRLP
jgi:hypothetical protein